MSSPKSPIRVAIIGGGMGGLATAIGLLKYPHIEVSIYESASKFSEIGAGIMLGPNAQHAMDEIDPRIKEAYYKVCVLGEEGRNPDGSYNWMNFYQGHGEGAGEHCVSMSYPLRPSTCHRAHILNELVKLVPSEICHFGKRLVSIDEGSESITVQFHDGTTAQADVVLGADGVHSRVREHLLGSDNPAAHAVFTGTVIYRALVPVEEVEAVIGKLSTIPCQYMGPNSMVVGYKVAGGKLFNMAVAYADVSNWSHDTWAVKADVSKVKHAFDGWADQPRKIASLLPEGKTMEWSVWDMPPAPYYNRDRISILGDAAHAATPYLGAGAGQAFEDALVLERVLGNAKDLSQVPAALAAYDTVRRYRSQRLVLKSREQGTVSTHSHPETGSDMAKIAQKAAVSQKWLWESDQAEQAADGIAIMRSLLDTSSLKMGQQMPADVKENILASEDHHALVSGQA